MAKLNQRLSPSGPVLGEFGYGTGFILQALTLDTLVSTGGALANAAQEIQTNMTDQASAHSLRPALPGVGAKNLLQVECGFDLNLLNAWVTSSIKTEIELSVDAGANWTLVHATTQNWPAVNATTPVGLRGHVQLKTPHILPSAITGYIDGKTVTARIKVSSASGVPAQAVVVSEGANGSAYATLYELLKVA